MVQALCFITAANKLGIQASEVPGLLRCPSGQSFLAEHPSPGDPSGNALLHIPCFSAETVQYLSGP